MVLLTEHGVGWSCLQMIITDEMKRKPRFEFEKCGIAGILSVVRNSVSYCRTRPKHFYFTTDYHRFSQILISRAICVNLSNLW